MKIRRKGGRKRGKERVRQAMRRRGRTTEKEREKENERGEERCKEPELDKTIEMCGGTTESTSQADFVLVAETPDT